MAENTPPDEVTVRNTGDLSGDSGIPTIGGEKVKHISHKHADGSYDGTIETQGGKDDGTRIPAVKIHPPPRTKK